MSYTTLTQNKRTQLKSQMDDFATFQWRGHDMWEKYGCFIINESKGSLKFYNGPGYSNKYAKSQFSSSTNTLIGVDFKQKTISMKVGMYWFTIEEYQEFLNEIGPYVVNYLTFGYEKNYGYLVKLANMPDSTRYVVGTNEKGEYVYYTEMDLTWELLGDNCVRSNFPYEYKRKENETEDNIYTLVFDRNKSDMQDESLLDTPILFELPLSFLNKDASLSLSAIYNEEPTTLFSIHLNNLTANSPDDLWKAKQYQLLHQNMSTYSYTSSGDYFNPNTKNFKTGLLSGRVYENEVEWEDEIENFTATYSDGLLTISTDTYAILNAENVENNFRHTSDSISIFIEDKDSFSIGVKYTEVNTDIEPEEIPVRYKDTDYSYAFFARDPISEGNGQNYFVLMKNINDFETAERIHEEQLVTLWDDKPEDEVWSYLKEDGLNVNLWAQIVNQYQMLLRYDSETGLIYIQEGNNDTWHLLNFQTDNNEGKYLLQSAQINKWKIPGKFTAPSLKSTNWQLKLETKNVSINMLPQEAINTSITVYARKNIV